jgi:hypothetical protein
MTSQVKCDLDTNPCAFFSEIRGGICCQHCINFQQHYSYVLLKFDEKNVSPLITILWFNYFRGKQYKAIIPLLIMRITGEPGDIKFISLPLSSCHTREFVCLVSTQTG